MKSLRKGLKRASFRLFEFAQKAGVFILPVHYYIPIASSRELKQRRDRWNRPIDLSCLPIDFDKQRRIMSEWIAPYESEYRGNRIYFEGVKNRAGPGYGYIEAQALHAFIRKKRPRRIIEVGSGVSTWCMLAALELNKKEDGQPFEFASIEPHPSDFLRSMPVELHKVLVEDVDLALFDRLQPNDFLFIDSSHAVRCCGDVARIFTEILPRIKPGVFVQIHDITFPYMFPRDVETAYMQAMETAMLFTLLANTTHFEILLCLSLLHFKEPDVLKRTFPEYDPQPNVGGLPGPDVAFFNDRRHFPSAIYLVAK